MVERVVFDFDGTIVDSFGLNLDLIKRIRPDLNENDVNTFKRLGARKACGELGVSWREVFRIGEIVKKEQKKVIENAKPFEGMSELLLDLKASGVETGIISSNSRENINDWLANNLTEVNWVKSVKNLFGKDRAINKVKSENMLYVGDEVRDIEACRKVGVRVVAVTWGYNDKEILMKAKPDYLVENSKELRNLFFNFSQ